MTRTKLSLLVVVLAGCTNEAGYDPLAAGQGAEEGPSEQPEYGRVVMNTPLGPRTMAYEVVNGVAIAEGDIELGPVEELDALIDKGLGVKDRDLRWPNRKIPFRFDTNVSSTSVSRTTAAMDHWEAVTDMDFVPQTTETTYVRFTTGNTGCTTQFHGKPASGENVVKLNHGRDESEIAGIGLMRSTQLVYAWYKDGTYSRGDLTQFDSNDITRTYSLPAGRTPSQIVGMDINSSGYTVTWYSDRKFTVGTASSLAAVSGAADYQLPAGYTTSQIVAIAFAPAGTVVTWYSDGKRSIGTQTNLAALNPTPVAFTSAAGATPGQLVDTLIRDNDDIVAYYDWGAYTTGTLADLDAVAGRVSYDTTVDCEEGTMIHELGHVVGLFHEQARCDAEDHINILWDNIIEDYKYAFNPEYPNAISCSSRRELDVYDIDSIMHYGSFAFSIDPDELPTMTEPDGSIFFANRDALTLSDRRSVQELYGYSPAAGKAIGSIVGIAADDTDTYTWHSDGTMTVGRSYDLDRVAAPVSFSLPPGRTASQIVAMDMLASGQVCTWYSDLTMSVGTPTDLDFYITPPVAYTLPAGQSVNTLKGISISAANKFYWYFSNGQRSVGNGISPTAESGLVNFSTAAGTTASQINEITISKANGRTYVWYTNYNLSIGSTTDLDQYQESW